MICWYTMSLCMRWESLPAALSQHKGCTCACSPCACAGVHTTPGHIRKKVKASTWQRMTACSSPECCNFCGEIMLEFWLGVQLQIDHVKA